MSIHVIGAGLADNPSSNKTSDNHFWKLKTPFGIRALGIGIAVVNVVFILVLLLGVDVDSFPLLLTILSMTVTSIFGIFLALSYIYLSIDAGPFARGYGRSPNAWCH